MTTNLLAAPVWKVDLDWFFVSKSAPSLAGDRVVVRCGPKVLVLDASSGALRGELVLDPPAANETFFLRLSGGGWVTDVHRQPERLTTVVAVDDAGAQRWRADLPAIVSARGGIVLGARLVVPVKQPGKGQQLVVFQDPARDAAFDIVPLDRGVTRLLPGAPDRLVAVDAVAAAGAPGLYEMGLDGHGAVTWATGPVLDVDVAGDHAIAVMRQAAGSRAAVFDRATGTQAWDTPVSAEAVTAHDDVAFTIEEGRAVCRALADGTIRWRSAQRAHKVTSASVVDRLLVLGHDRGREILAVEDGADIGTLPSGYGPLAVTDDAIYVAGSKSVVCARRRLTT